MEIKNHNFDSCFPKVENVEGHHLYQFKVFGSSLIISKELNKSLNRRPSSRNQLTTNNPHELMPSLEFQVFGGHSTANSPPPFPTTTSLSIRISSTHTPYQILGETLNSSDCRVVYIARNPKDTVISLWLFENSIDLFKHKPRPLEDTVSKFCDGTVYFGPYFDHVLGYHKVSLERPEKFFFITYEELKSDRETHVKRLAEFLGCPFEGEDLKQQVDEVVRSCSMETLKKYEVNNSSDVPSWSVVSNKSFFRKGQVGDHMNYLTEDMIERIDAITKVKFRGVNLWEKLECSSDTVVHV